MALSSSVPGVSDGPGPGGRGPIQPARPPCPRGPGPRYGLRPERARVGRDPERVLLPMP